MCQMLWLSHSDIKRLTATNKERGRFLVESVKVCVLRLKNSSRTMVFTKYVYFLLKTTKNKFKKKVNINFYRSNTVLTYNT